MIDANAKVLVRRCVAVRLKGRRTPCQLSSLTRDDAHFFEELISLIQVSFFIKFRRLEKLASVPASDSTALRSTERVLLPRTCLKCRR